MVESFRESHIWFCDAFRNCRLQTGKTLRQFCIDNGFDHITVSKIERGVVIPPPEEELKKYADALGLQEGSEDYNELFELATRQKEHIPYDLSKDEVLVKRLPILATRSDGTKLTEEQMRELIETMRTV